MWQTEITTRLTALHHMLGYEEEQSGAVDHAISGDEVESARKVWRSVQVLKTQVDELGRERTGLERFASYVQIMAAFSTKGFQNKT